MRDTSTGEESVLHVTKEQAQGGSDSHLRDPKTGRELEVVDKVSWCLPACLCVCGRFRFACWKKSRALFPSMDWWLGGWVVLVIHTTQRNTTQISLVEWFADNYTKFGTTLEFVTNRSQEGNQFCKGFGGVGGLLRWKVGGVCVWMHFCLAAV